ncbi:MAG: FG-GAP-like repeat-containing protein, partial [Bacteroidota bacterium]
LDLAITNNYNGSANTVSVLRNLSNPSNLIFDTALDFATGISPISPSIGDFDGDNKLDLVTVNSSNSSVSVLRNTSIIGAINFATKIDFTTGMVPKSVAISDLDGDGKLDLAVTNELSNTISIFRNTSNLGSISFSSKVDFPTGSGPASVSICDLDGNSKPDLIIANGGTNTISIIRNICTIGNINFSPKTDITTGTAPKYLTVGDLDGDNSPDIAISNTNSNTLSILRNTSSPSNINFNAKVDFNTGPGAVSISIGDLDADGKPDLAIANNYNNISIYPNTSISGTIGFSNKVDFITASNPQAVLIADLDGDGKLDFATAHNSGPFYIFRNIPQFPAPTITSISPTSGVVGDTLEIIGTGFSSTPTKNIVYFGATRANIISVNTNSIKVTVPNGTTYGPISLLNTSIEKIAYSSQFFKQTFRPNKNTITNADFDSKLNFGPGYLTERVSIGDLDGDGKPDLAIARTNSISILRNTCVLGGINFASTVDFNIGQNPNSLDIGDIDGDGKQDIAITYGSSISIMRNNSNIGVLNFISTYAIANNAYSIEINDMDGDGKPDLVVGDINNGIVSLYLNNGSKGLISFANKIDISIGFPCAFVVGDIDGDRKPDIVVVNSGVSILRNTSSIGVLSFVAQVGFSIGLNPSALIALGDIDADGRLDLGVANYNNNTVSVLRNTSSIGSVSFTTKVDFPTGMGPSSVAFGDINGDGKLDLTITNSSSNSNSVSVLCNIGSLNAINFATKVDFGTSLIPRSTEIGDIDGDGKPELVITGDASIAVMRNNPKIPPTITSFIPQNAAFGDTLKIIGTSFSDTIANNIVFLGSAKATVIAANDSIVKIVVPAGASFAPITLLNTSNALAGISSQFFNPIFRPSKGSINSGDIAAKLDFVSSSQPVSAIIGDIDLDGKPDLAIANRGSNSVSILRNIGNSNAIGFASKIDFPTGIQPSSIAFGDINGDGKPDLAISNRTSNTISILRNTSTTGSISFANKIDFITNIGPNSVVIGDFNGDGKLDLALLIFGSYFVTVGAAL